MLEISTQQQVRGDNIRKAIENNKYFNRHFSKVIIKTLECHGLVFDDAHYYSPLNVEKQIQMFLSKEIAQSIAKLIEADVQDLAQNWQ